VAATTVVLAVNLLAGRAGAGATQGHAPESRNYVVQPGDTLWGIASSLAGPQADPRPLVDRLARSNHVDAGIIHVGDVLVVPLG
jgi:LysM domain